MKVYVLVQVDEELHETEGCECGCGEGWETNYQTHCAVIKVSTNLKKLKAIKLAAEKQNEEIIIYNQKLSDEYNKLVQAENARVNKLYTEQTAVYKVKFEEYKNTVNNLLTVIGKKLYPNKTTRATIDWFTHYNHDYYPYQIEEIVAEFYKKFQDLKLNDKPLNLLCDSDLHGYQRFKKIEFERPVFKEHIIPYQIIEKELED